MFIAYTFHHLLSWNYSNISNIYLELKLSSGNISKQTTSISMTLASKWWLICKSYHFWKPDSVITRFPFKSWNSSTLLAVWLLLMHWQHILVCILHRYQETDQKHFPIGNSRQKKSGCVIISWNGCNRTSDRLECKYFLSYFRIHCPKVQHFPFLHLLQGQLICVTCQSASFAEYPAQPPVQPIDRVNWLPPPPCQL